MDDPILRPRGADGFATSTDVANLKLGIADGDAHLFISGSEKPASIPCKAGELYRPRQDLYGIVPLRHRGNANARNDNNRGDLPQEVRMQHAITTKAISRATCRVVCALVVALLAALMLTQKADAKSIRVACDIYATNRFDPIGNTQHLHRHFGNTSLSNQSTGQSLYNNKNASCVEDNAEWWTNAGWFPVERYEPVAGTIVYYRDPGDHGDRLINLRQGMLLIGKIDPTNNMDEITYSCGSSPGDPQPNYTSPVYGCTDNWSTNVRFPRCWDGIGIEHTDFRYGPNRQSCPSSHPYILPEINYLIRHLNTDGEVPRPLTVSAGVDQWESWEHMHGDYFFAAQDEFTQAMDLNGDGRIQDNAGTAGYNGGYSESSLMDLCLREAPNSLEYNNERCRTGGLLSWQERALNNYYN